MIAKAIKEYEKQFNYSRGVKVSTRFYKSLYSEANGQMKTVNVFLNQSVIPAIRRGLEKESDRAQLIKVNLRGAYDGKHRVKLSQENYSWLEQLRAELISEHGVVVSQAVLLDVALSVATMLSAQTQKTKRPASAQKVERENIKQRNDNPTEAKSMGHDDLGETQKLTYCKG